ncbi:putative SOS response-associated peptidase YedK [Flavobacterium sp. CG_9.1]|uniref:SOS response-associated peptidase n=1 Tax=Flavobacterium sp. CG_9.1 TaxID=2787728 RepID=UPI0018CB0381|nr:SOS response-associated peptidase [Flavobacterium sp. CG_9.1]MBG6062035.1 putative SOS response-associated peptidase YedK [Flavobacterium sp. CG_9.1]
MCFHTIQNKLSKQIEKRFKAKISEKTSFATQEHFNGFAFPKTPIITNNHPEIIEHYNWGLIPSWAKNDQIKAMTLNARIETVEDKHSFRDVIHQRCLIIATGFYEWQWLDAKGNNKMKYQIGIKNDALCAFAGLYSHWTDTNTGEIRNTYTMLTTVANPLMAEIHNHKKRMPIILNPEDENRWLDQTPIQEFAFPYTVDLVARKIDTDFPPLLLF